LACDLVDARVDDAWPHLGRERARNGSTFSFTANFGVGPTRLSSRERRLPAGLRVLVVDDNAVNRRILVGQLTRWDTTPIVVPGGREALETLVSLKQKGERVDLILLDAQMPGMDGFELAKRSARAQT
jgi:PleD family two-component response regulator